MSVTTATTSDSLLVGIREALPLWRLQEAPLDWQFDKVWGRFTVEVWLIGIAVLFAFDFCIALLSGFSTTAVWVLLVSIGLVCCTRAFILWRPSVSVQRMGLLLGVSLTTNFWYYAVSFSPSLVYAHRSTGMIAICWRAMVPFFGFEFKPCALFLVANTAVECSVMRFTMVKLGAGEDIHRLDIFSMGATCLSFLWLCHQVVSSHSLWSVQEELKAEMAASESLLSMVCDATAWVDGDGDTVLRSNARLDEILGSRMEGRLLSGSVSATEHCRLQGAFLSCRVDWQQSCDQRPTAVLLPTTFLRQTAPPINADLFIVHRRPNFALTIREKMRSSCSRFSVLAPARKSSAFLLGFRLSQITEVAPMPQDEEHAAATKKHPASGRRRHVRDSSVSESIEADSASLAGSLRKGPCIRKCGKALPVQALQTIPPLNGFRVSDKRYFTACAQSILEDLLQSANLDLRGCCRWHASLRTLSKWVDEMHQWRACAEPWPAVPPAWQCTNCCALISCEEDDMVCWICSSARSCNS